MSGYLIVENVLTEKECEQYIKEMWDWLEGLESGIDRNDPSSWTSENWPQNSRGIISCYNVGHAPFLWRLRQNPHVLEIFSKLWNVKGAEDLLVSFDGCCIQRPTKRPTQNWLHIDQTLPEYKGKRVCIQGHVTMTDIGGDSGVSSLCVLEGSHKYHAEFIDWMKENHSSEAQPDNNYNWFKLPDYAIDWYKNVKGCREVLLPIPKGSLTLWDSRLVHCTGNNNKPNKGFRYVCYLCYIPRKLNGEEPSSKMLDRKKKAFREKRTTNHWPLKFKLNGKNPRFVDKTYFNVDNYSLPEESGIVKKLIGG